ncbi:fibrocystin [Pontoporia blainvillei]|uniref:Fibrocystin n=1 Tax=Pontoporia blainvillei TaxID=48723 RepID=A0ABX0SAX2_PONBL|nr:fibrocystin [Pontoporia blainvillei]
MWDLSGPRHEPVSPTSAGGLSTTAPPGKPAPEYFLHTKEESLYEVTQGNRVCAAGYGYFFHLVTNQTSQAPLLSFTGNSAHACKRCGLFVYPKFQPTWDNGTGPTLFQNFTVWGSAGGAQIFRSSNLHLKNFQVYACRDFGIDILESDANTSVTDSLLLAHFAPKGSLCMSAGIKTPKRWELTVSNTTFVNFDLTDCVAIRTCSGCSRGQGEGKIPTLYKAESNFCFVKMMTRLVWGLRSGFTYGAALDVSVFRVQGTPCLYECKIKVESNSSKHEYPSNADSTIWG